MYYFRLGVTGAAISTVASQYVLSLSDFLFFHRLTATTIIVVLIVHWHFCVNFLFVRYIVTILMIWHLNKKTVLILPDMKDLEFGGYLKSGELVLSFEIILIAMFFRSKSL